MSRRTHVVVFLTDQQRWDTVGLAGCPLGLTPNFDYWATRGTHFSNATTPQPMCVPARACLQTGRFATAIGDGMQVNNRALPTDADTIAKRFRDAGYATGYFGKWHLGGPGGTTQAVPASGRGGWEAGTWLAADLFETCSDGYHTTLYDDADNPVRLPGYRVDAVTDAAIRYVDAHADVPFLLMVSHLEPHMQNHRDAHPAPAGYEERYRGRWTPPDLAALSGFTPFYRHMTGGNAQQALPGYLGSVKRLDEAFGRFMDALMSLGLLDDTVVAFASDHGCHFRTRNDEYKRSVHDVSCRVPCMIHGGAFTGGGRDARPFQLTDLAPTLCAAAGVDTPRDAQGRDARSTLPDEAFIQVSVSECSRAVRTDRWKYAATAPDAKPCDRHATHYVESHLYDLVADPYELVNLAGLASHKDVRDNLKARLLRRMADAGEPAAYIADAPHPDLEPGQWYQREVRPTDALHPPTA